MAPRGALEAGSGVRETAEGGGEGGRTPTAREGCWRAPPPPTLPGSGRGADTFVSLRLGHTVATRLAGAWPSPRTAAGGREARLPAPATLTSAELTSLKGKPNIGTSE